MAGRQCSRIRKNSEAFTLIEVILVLAILALLSTLTIGVTARMLRQRTASPDEVFSQACQLARTEALKSEREVRLSFDDKTKAFVCDDGLVPQSLPVPKAPADLAIDFHSNQAATGNLVLVGGTLEETQPIPYVTFYADGTCSPFHVQFRSKGAAHTIAIDPWTCAPMLAPIPANES